MSRKYAAMRPSDIPWLREIPEHWKVSPMRAVALPKQVRNTGMIESNLLSLSYGRIVRKDITTSDGLLPESFETYQIVDRDDVVFRFTDLQNDKRSLRSALVAERGIITSAYVAVRTKDVDPRFFAYLMRAWDLSKVFYGLGGGVRQSLKFSDVARLPVLLPSPSEQRAIADFLDRETAQIDTLIAKQQRLIATLRERQSAVVSSAVTRGLDPHCSLTPSGVETLGDIPAHWRVARIKSVGRALIGLTYAPEDVVGEGEGVLVLRAGNIKDGRIVLDDSVFVAKEVPDELRLRRGDIVICARNGSAKLVGKSAAVTDLVVGQTWGAFMTVLRSEVNDYLRWVLRSEIFRAHVGNFSTSTINQLTSRTLHDLQFALPPERERTEISAYLDRKVSAIDTLIQKSERLIELSQERRAALITAAVTGQVDVRKAA